MSIREHIPSAQMKNRHEQTELRSELQRLESEKKTELKMTNNEQQRFKAKFGKMSYSLESSIGGSSIRMYNTLAYRRDSKTSQSLSQSSSIDFEYIHSLLFTNGEIDIDKILCLHLLSSHSADTLQYPLPGQRTRRTSRDHPVDRILERSNKKAPSDSLLKMLPTYIIVPVSDISDGSKPVAATGSSTDGAGAGIKQASDSSLDARLTARLVVNEKIVSLVQTVLRALQNSNPEKLEELIAIAQDISKIKSVFRKAEIQEFLRMLKSSYLINSGDSFILTPPFKTRPILLEIKTVSGTLENVVRHIRKSIAQYPSRSTWLKMYEESMAAGTAGFTGPAPPDQDKEKEELEKKEKAEKEAKAQAAAPRSIRRSVDETAAETAAKRAAASRDRAKEQERRASEESQMMEKMLGRHVKTDFIAKNKAAVANVKRKEPAEEENTPQFRRSSQESQASSVASNRRKMLKSRGVIGSSTGASSGHVGKAVTSAPLNTIDQERQSYEDALTQSSHSDTESANKCTHSKADLSLSVTDYGSSKKRKSEDSDSKQFIKQTTCPACMQKYKTPLPTPKTPRKTRLQEDDDKGLKTNTAQRLNHLITREKFMLEAYDKRYSSDSGTSRSTGSKRPSGQKFSFDSVRLDPIDLAKVDQEVRVKETQKKLEKFLDE